MKSPEPRRPRRSQPRDLATGLESGWVETRHDEALRGEERLLRRRDLLTFAVADEEYAVGIESIREIIKCRPVTEVPRVPSFVAGIVAVRGVVMPVIDLRLRLHLPAAQLLQRARILVVTRPADPHEPDSRDPYGLIVDAVHEVIRLGEQDIEPATMLAGAEAEFIAGIGRLPQEEAAKGRGLHDAAGVQRRMLILLDLQRVLTFDLLPGPAALPGAAAASLPAAAAVAPAGERERWR